MAKTWYAITMDFANAKKQAEELERIAREIEQLLNHQFDSSMDVISKSWQGENAAAYMGKGKIVRDDIARLAKKINDAAGVILEIARKTYEAEMKAYRLAQLRKH